MSDKRLLLSMACRIEKNTTSLGTQHKTSFGTFRDRSLFSSHAPESRGDLESLTRVLVKLSTRVGFCQYSRMIPAQVLRTISNPCRIGYHRKTSHT